MFLLVIAMLMTGFPVAFVLAGSSLLFALIGEAAGVFDFSVLGAVPSRLYGIMTNETLIAVPLFVFMGTMLQHGKITEELLEQMGRTFGRTFGNLRGGLAVSVCVVGAMLAASTGIIGATVVTMGLISLPCMLRNRYHPRLACGVITASGTLGQIIPPSIVLVILGDTISNANQKAQLDAGNFQPSVVSVGDLFFGALTPGIVLVLMYIIYIIIIAAMRPSWAPAYALDEQDKLSAGGTTHTSAIILAPLVLIICVLGSIIVGIATPTEAAAIGSGGALVLSLLRGGLTLNTLADSGRQATHITCKVFMLLIGANIFSLVFRGFGGDEVITEFVHNLPGGMVSAFILIMLLIFLLGFFLDFIEIIFVIVPVVAPILITLGIDPIWLGVIIAINLQTSFLTPPFGFALFYLRGVAPPEVKTGDIYRGSIPFIFMQLALIVLLWFYPGMVTWLPEIIYQ